MSGIHPWETTRRHYYLEIDSDGKPIECAAAVSISLVEEDRPKPFTGRSAHAIQRNVLHRHSMEIVWVVALVSRTPRGVVIRDCAGWTNEVSRQTVATFSAKWWRPAGEDRQETSGFEDGMSKAVAAAEQAKARVLGGP